MQLIRSRIALYAGKGPDLDRGSYEQLKQARELCSGGGITRVGRLTVHRSLVRSVSMKARLLTAICVTAAIAVVEGQSEVPYPTGYRDWSHIKSMVIEEGHPLFEAFGGIHHIYANDEASPAIKTDASQTAR